MRKAIRDCALQAHAHSVDPRMNKPSANSHSLLPPNPACAQRNRAQADLQRVDARDPARLRRNDRLDDRNRIRTEWKKCRRTGRLDNARPVGKREQEDRLQREEEEQQERGRHHTERVGEGKREN